MMQEVTFDQISEVLIQLAEELGPELRDVGTIYAVRDLWGRVRFVVPMRPEPGSVLAGAVDKLARLAAERLGRHGHPADQAVLYGDETLTSPSVWKKSPSVELHAGPPAWRLLDRQVTGSSWATIEEPGPAELGAAPHRLAFYSLKGGVGRSTATAVTAWHLAQQGRSVLVLDLDLESPGLSASLLPADRLPEFGIVDWFVEDAVGGAGHMLRSLAARSPLADELSGEVWVVPSHGADPGEYIAKLGRCYLDLPAKGGTEAWEHRLRRLLVGLEGELKPDVVLLDTRSGLHDLASTAVTDLAHDVLLFAVGSEQTWAGYRLLFDHWCRFEVARAIRERLKIVAGLVPETDREAYLSEFQQRSWDLFVNNLYDELAEGELEGFSFDLDDPSAPHSPWLIYWNRGFASLGSLQSLDPQLVDAAHGSFLRGLDELLAAGTERP